MSPAFHGGATGVRGTLLLSREALLQRASPSSGGFGTGWVQPYFNSRWCKQQALVFGTLMAPDIWTTTKPTRPGSVSHQGGENLTYRRCLHTGHRTARCCLWGCSYAWKQWQLLSLRNRLGDDPQWHESNSSRPTDRHLQQPLASTPPSQNRLARVGKLIQKLFCCSLCLQPPLPRIHLSWCSGPQTKTTL